jgi:hypothetical protein
VNPENHRTRAVVIVVAALGAALLVLAIVSQAVFHTSIDPTESTFAVTLHNDMPNVVVVKQCDAKCNSFHEKDRLAPGESVSVNTSSDNVANWWAVSDGSGNVLGCLPLQYRHKIEGVVVNLSQTTSCPAGTGSSASDVVGTIVGLGVALLVGGVAITSTVSATMASYQQLQRWGLDNGVAIGATVMPALVIFLGGWIVFDVYVIARQGARLVRRPSPAT